MRAVFADLLACPDCGGDLRIRGLEQSDGHVLEGDLRCSECSQVFPLRRGVPRLLPHRERQAPERELTASRFAYEWSEFSSFRIEEETESMMTWFRPRSLEDLAGLTVLDAGCGMGRHAVIAATKGARRIVGIDLGTSVEAAFDNTRHLPSVCIVQGDLYYPPVADEAYDAAYSLGVLHHLPDPARGFREVSRKVKEGGWFQVWVYAREGNRWLLTVLNPVRRLTSKAPLTLLKGLAALVTIPLVLAARTLYRLPGIGPRLPYAPYIRWLSRFSFAKTHAIVLDHALAPVAHYLERSKVEELAHLPGWQLEGIEHSRGMSWGMTARRRAQSGKVQVSRVRGTGG